MHFDPSYWVEAMVEKKTGIERRRLKLLETQTKNIEQRLCQRKQKQWCGEIFMVLVGTITVRSWDKGSLKSPSQHKQGYWSREQCALPAGEMWGWPACPSGPLEIFWVLSKIRDFLQVSAWTAEVMTYFSLLILTKNS